MNWSKKEKDYLRFRYYQVELDLRKTFNDSCEFSTYEHDFDEAVDIYCHKLDAITDFMVDIGAFSVDEGMNKYNFFAEMADKIYFEKVKLFAENGLKYYE